MKEDIKTRAFRIKEVSSLGKYTSYCYKIQVRFLLFFATINYFRAYSDAYKMMIEIQKYSKNDYNELP